MSAQIYSRKGKIIEKGLVKYHPGIKNLPGGQALPSNG